MSAPLINPCPVAVATAAPLVLATNYIDAQASCARRGAVLVAVDPAAPATYLIDSLPTWVTLRGLYVELHAVPPAALSAEARAVGILRATLGTVTG